MERFTDAPYYLSAYGIAVKHGYTGTEEEWITELMRGAALAAEDAKEYRDAAAGSATNAGDSANIALVQAQTAQAYGSMAERYGAGTYGGEPLPDTDPAYHNNASYYAGEAKNYADHIADPVAGLVTGWLNDHVDPATGYVIDDTLLVSNAAADAAAAGSRLTALEQNARQILLTPSALTYSGITWAVASDGTVTVTGTATQSTQNNLLEGSLPQGVTPGGWLYVDYATTDDNVRLNVVFYDSEDTDTVGPYLTAPGTIWVPRDAVRWRVRLHVPSGSDMGEGAVVSRYAVYAGDSVLPTAVPVRRVYSTLTELMADAGLVPPMTAETLGMTAAGDLGGGKYSIVAELAEGESVDNASIFSMGNGYYAKRVFDSDSVYLESLNFPTVNYSVVNDIIFKNGIKKVRCGNLETSKSIVIAYNPGVSKDYDFEFGVLTYTGTDYAIRTDGMSENRIIGENITATDGSGIYITETHRSWEKNRVDILRINVKLNGITITPRHSHGAGGNSTFIIGKIEAGLRGIYTYIPDSYNYVNAREACLNEQPYVRFTDFQYSWQGETYFEVGTIRANPTKQGLSPEDVAELAYPGFKGTAVSFIIAATPVYIKRTAASEAEFRTSYTEVTNSAEYEALDTDAEKLAYEMAHVRGVARDVNVCGTVTGVTFGHLSVEYSERGIVMNCGLSIVSDSRLSEAGIKSVTVNNMRAREIFWTDLFLDCGGYIKDIYIKPTSPIRLHQWRLNTTASRVSSYVDAAIMKENNRWSTIGYGLKAVNGVRYIREPMPYPITISGDTDFRRMMGDPNAEDPDDRPDPTLYMAKMFYILDNSELRGTTIKLNMGFHYAESAQDLIFRIPKANTRGGIRLEFIFPRQTDDPDHNPHIVNNDPEYDHYYNVSCYRSATSSTVNQVVIRDLGPILYNSESTIDTGGEDYDPDHDPDPDEEEDGEDEEEEI